jgi:hypothetical protein
MINFSVQIYFFSFFFGSFVLIILHIWKFVYGAHKTNTITLWYYDNDRYGETINSEQQSEKIRSKIENIFQPILYNSSGVCYDIGTSVDNTFPIFDGNLSFFFFVVANFFYTSNKLEVFHLECHPNVRLSVILVIKIT